MSWPCQHRHRPPTRRGAAGEPADPMRQAPEQSLPKRTRVMYSFKTMVVQTTYTDARAHLAELLDRAGQDLETVIISRRGAPDVALVSAEELRGLQEVAHLFRSPANARRLLEAMERSDQGGGLAMTLDELRATVAPTAGPRPSRPPRRSLRRDTRSPTRRPEPERQAAAWTSKPE
jgi:antitoxin YefM